jgi:hypothetical protein
MKANVSEMSRVGCRRETVPSARSSSFDSSESVSEEDFEKHGSCLNNFSTKENVCFDVVTEIAYKLKLAAVKILSNSANELEVNRPIKFDRPMARRR